MSRPPPEPRRRQSAERRQQCVGPHQQSPRPRRVVSLRWELAEIARALDGARLLGDELSIDQRGDDAVSRDAARAARGVLSLVHARLQLIGGVIAGEVDHGLLLARHNELDDAPEDDEPDVYLGEKATPPQQRATRPTDPNPTSRGGRDDAR